MRQLKKVRLYVNTTKPAALVKAKSISRQLRRFGYLEVDKDEDIVIGLGGDGTLFHLLQESNYNVNAKYIGVNCGTLGFLQDFDAEDITSFVASIPHYVEQKLNFVCLEIKSCKESKKFYALNEFSLQDVERKTFKTNVFVAGEKLEDYVGTGIVFSTATGSTALNLSAGGAILHPSIKAIQMTPREAIVNSKMHSLSKSICFPMGMDIVLHPTLENKEIVIISDGKEVYSGAYDSIRITYSDRGITKLKKFKDSFTKTIREKLI